MKTVPTLRVVTDTDAPAQLAELGIADLPEQVQLAVADVASAAREGPLAMSVAAGMTVMRSWTGIRLLQHLTNRVEPDSPHLPLNLYTLHALIASRPSLLNGRPAVRASLAEVLDRLASTDCLTRTERDQLAGLQYALRIADQ